MNKFVKVLKNPLWIIVFLNNRGIHLLDDEKFIKLHYRLTMGKKIDLNHPKTFNEKLQWLKLNDRNPKYTKMVDKYEAKKYVASIIGEDYIIPTLGIYTKFDDINFDKLPNQFVMKCTHDSGGIIIVKDKSKLDIKSARKKFNKLLTKNFYYSSREWPYKNVKPQIMIEKYMVNGLQTELNDYKVMCFNGNPQMTFTCTDRFSDELKVTFFDLDWNELPFERHHPKSRDKIQKPKNYSKMIQMSKQLSKNMLFLRVDWYEVNGKLYFGELTFYPGSGFEEFNPDEWDYKLGQMLDLKK